MATQGGMGGSSATPVPNQAQGAEYGLPRNQIRGIGGEETVQVPADVADRFNAAVNKQSGSSEGVASNIDRETHPSGMEPVTDRARNLTAVTEEKVRTGGQGETRTPDVGFPAREEQEKRGGQL